jgi:hypothetical protein
MKRIKNNTQASKTYSGQEIQSGQYYTIQTLEEQRFSSDLTLIADLISSAALMNDGSNDFTNPSEGIEFLQNKTPTNVKTQFERDDITIKMAKVKATIVSGSARIELKVPGTPGVDSGRYIAGGYGMLDSYDPDDMITCTIEDVDRMIAWQAALAIDPEAEAPLSDETIQGLGDFPSYPVVGSYTDDELDSANQGWYFWPLARGGTEEAIGEVELEPLGYYGIVPSGFYLVFTITRPNVSGGVVRGDIVWGKKEE